MNQQLAQLGLFIGMDWADQKHDIFIIDPHGKGSHQQLEHTAERDSLQQAFGHWLSMTDLSSRVLAP